MFTSFSTFFSKFLSILILLVTLQTVTVEYSFATDTSGSGSGSGSGTTANDALSCTLQRIVATLSGPMGKAIATIAIIALGIGLFMGKLSWGLAVATALGVAMIFGAGTIVDWLSNSGFSGTINCDNSNNGN